MSIYQSEALKLDATSKEMLKEMGEDPAQKLSQIEVIRNWIISHNYLECRTDDKFILRFLRVAKFSCEAAKERILKWCIARTSKLDGMPDWYTNRSIDDPVIREILDTGMFYLVPKPDKLGRLVVIFELEKLGVKKFDPVNFVKAFYMIVDWIVFTYDRTQVNGVALIEVGSNNFDMEQLKYWTPERMKKSVEVWQGTPMRTKVVHYYNMPTVMRGFIEMALKLMKPKLAKRVKLHSDQKFDDDIPAECMPKSLGGTAPSWDEIRNDMMREMENFQAEFSSLEMCKVDDAKIPKKYEEGDSWGITGTYRTIAKDD